MLKALFSPILSRTRSPRPSDAGHGLPAAANQNLPILRPGKDPAAALARVRLILTLVRQENSRQGTLLSRPEWRRYYEDCLALERAIVWKYFEWR